MFILNVNKAGYIKVDYYLSHKVYSSMYSMMLFYKKYNMHEILKLEDLELT